MTEAREKKTNNDGGGANIGVRFVTPQLIQHTAHTTQTHRNHVFTCMMYEANVCTNGRTDEWTGDCLAI